MKYAPLYARIALAAAFLSAVAARFSRPFSQFIEATADVNSFLPHALAPTLAVTATIAEITLAVALLFGFRLRWTAPAAAVLLALFGTAMAISHGIKEPLDYSVFSASACALLLGRLSESRESS